MGDRGNFYVSTDEGKQGRKMITTKQALETNLSIIRKLTPRKAFDYKRLVTLQSKEMYYTNNDTFLTLPLPSLGDGLDKTVVSIFDLVTCLKTLSKGTVELKLDGDSLLLKQGSMVYTLFVHKDTDIPSPPEYTYTEQNLPQNILEKSFVCVHAAAEKDPRIFLNGVLFEPLADTSQHGIRFVATDGNRLVLTDSLYSKEVSVNQSFIVGKDTLALLQLLGKKGFRYNYFGTVLQTVTYKHNNWLKVGGEYTLVTRGIDADYPDYNMVIPRSSSYSFTLTKDFANYLTGKEHTKFSFTPGNIHLSSQGLEGIGFSHNVANETITFTSEVGINARFVVDALEHSPTDTLQVRYEDNLSPIVFEAPGYKAVVMPVSVS